MNIATHHRQVSYGITSEMHNALDALCMPCTPNRAAKADLLHLSRADRAHHFTPDGTSKFDGVSGPWCCNAEIVKAAKSQLGALDFAPTFLFGHPAAFALAGQMAPADLNHFFFTNSGSDATNTALIIGFAYQVACRQPRRSTLIGRNRTFHGADLCGISAGDLPGLSHVVGVRCVGLAGTVELAARPGAPTMRAREVFLQAFHQENLVIRYTGDMLVFTPSLVATEEKIVDMSARIGDILKSLG